MTKIGPQPLLGDYPDKDAWASAEVDWIDAVFKLPKAERYAMFGTTPPKPKPAPEPELSCGPPGYDYTDHLVEYEGHAILDINLPAGEKGSPITSPGWTEVDPEQWSNEYKHEQRRTKAAQN